MRRLLRCLPLVMAVTMVPAVAACGLAGTSSQRGLPAPSSRASQARSPAPSLPARPVPSPTGRILMPGMSGADVRWLQQQLAALKYYPGTVDGQFGSDTLEAVWAFQEVQGLTPSGEVTPAMQRALAHPRSPAVLVPNGGSLRVEISLSHHVLVLYRADEVALISHVSTGGGYYFCSPGGGCGYAITPAGDYRTVAFMPGWVTVPLGEMYNPVFFIGTAYAIHGDTYVPLQPVSHGCVRIPMDIAQFFHGLVNVPGTPVYIRR